MAKLMLPSCSIPAMASRDGVVGPSAKLYLPFHGYWCADGSVLSWSSAEEPQDKTMRSGGVSMPNTYQKDCCTCSGEGVGLLIVEEEEQEPEPRFNLLAAYSPPGSEAAAALPVIFDGFWNDYMQDAYPGEFPCFVLSSDEPGCVLFLGTEEECVASPLGLVWINAIPLEAGVVYTASFKILPIDAFVYLIRGDGTDGIYVDLNVPEVALQSPSIDNASVTGPDGDGYYTVSFDFTATGTSTYPIQIFVQNSMYPASLSPDNWGHTEGSSPFCIKDVSVM